MEIKIVGEGRTEKFREENFYSFREMSVFVVFGFFAAPCTLPL